MGNNNTHKIIIAPGSSDVEVKRSHFLGVLKAVRSEDEARAFIEEVRKKHYDARHNCFAMRIGTPDSVMEKSGDDGEPQGTAGRPMLELLKGACLYDVCAVVTRYFGGTLLGTGGLVRAYSDSLREAIDRSETAELVVGRQLRITCGYSLAERIRRLAAGMKLHAVKEDFAADCTLTYLVRQQDAAAFSEKVTELSLGSSEPVDEGEVLFADGERPFIYG